MIRHLLRWNMIISVSFLKKKTRSICFQINLTSGLKVFTVFYQLLQITRDNSRMASKVNSHLVLGTAVINNSFISQFEGKKEPVTCVYYLLQKENLPINFEFGSGTGVIFLHFFQTA